jgi:hypothetical protein
MKPNTHTSDIGLGIHSVLQRADQEIKKLKKATLSPKSKYWKPMKKVDTETSKVGVNRYEFSEGNLRGTYDEWLRAYDHFCNQTVNTKGQKVNRLSYGKGHGFKD